MSSNGNNGNNGNNSNGSSSPSSPTLNGNTGNVTTNTSNVTTDSGNVFISNKDDITSFTLNQTLGDGTYVVTNQQGFTANGNVVTYTTFDTIANATIDIDEDLQGVVSANYETNNQIVTQIRDYANKIKCEEFHQKGSIDDYNALFEAASRIANETKQMKLDVDVEGFNEFGQAADELSALFTSFTKRLQSVNIIDDTSFLTAVLNALIKIDNLSNVFGKFKDTILLTSTIRIPQSAHDTKLILEGVMGEVSCAMNYINHFVDPTSSNSLVQANLSVQDKNIINKAVETIDNWNILCEQGVSIALNNNTDIQYLKLANDNLKLKTNTLKNATATLRNKLNTLIN
jgi:hypothetical protein